MGRDGKAEDLEFFLTARGDALLRMAVLLAAGRASGEDLLQEALERLVRHWHRIHGDPEGYLRRTLYNLAVDGWRQRARRPEILGLPAHAATTNPADQADLRLDLLDALALLPSRERAVVVARYWEQLSEAETALALGCTISAVKSASYRGLRRLRESLEPGHRQSRGVAV